MKKWITVCLGGVLAASSFLMLASCSDGADPSADRQGKKFSSPDVTYTVSANKEEHAVSDELFGVFLEDINYAGYVLDDNLVANGSFSYRSGTDRWTQQGLAATVEEGEGALHENNPAYARLEIYELDASLVNEGYQMSPMAVEEGVEYTFSAFVKAGSFAGTLTAQLRAASSMDWLELGTVQFDVQPSDEWVKYTGTITAAHTADEGVTLRLAFGNTGEAASTASLWRRRTAWAASRTISTRRSKLSLPPSSASRAAASSKGERQGTPITIGRTRWASTGRTSSLPLPIPRWTRRAPRAR